MDEAVWREQSKSPLLDPRYITAIYWFLSPKVQTLLLVLDFNLKALGCKSSPMILFKIIEIENQVNLVPEGGYAIINFLISNNKLAALHFLQLQCQ